MKGEASNKQLSVFRWRKTKAQFVLLLYEPCLFPCLFCLEWTVFFQALGLTPSRLETRCGIELGFKERKKEKKNTMVMWRNILNQQLCLQIIIFFWNLIMPNLPCWNESKFFFLFCFVICTYTYRVKTVRHTYFVPILIS